MDGMMKAGRFFSLGAHTTKVTNRPHLQLQLGGHGQRPFGLASRISREIRSMCLETSRRVRNHFHSQVTQDPITAFGLFGDPSSLPPGVA